MADRGTASTSDGRTSDGPTAVGSERAHSGRPPLPFSLRVLITYLVVDAAVELSWLTARYFSTEEYSITREDLWIVLISSFYLLLVPQILVRSVAARVSLTVVFSVQIAVFLVNYALQTPDAWSTATAVGRIQQIAKVVFFSVFMVLLNRKPVSDILRL